MQGHQKTENEASWKRPHEAHQGEIAIEPEERKVKEPPRHHKKKPRAPRSKEATAEAKVHTLGSANEEKTTLDDFFWENLASVFPNIDKLLRDLQGEERQPVEDLLRLACPPLHLGILSRGTFSSQSCE